MTPLPSYVRHDITFGSDGTPCAAWLYRPDGIDNPPIVVLAHGFAAFRELRLDAYAARFAQAGYAALVFDYRHWGASGGQPRRVLDIAAQHADWRAAVAYARRLDNVDTDRVVAWGSSFGGGHVLDLASRDRDLAAAIVQVPHVTGPASAFAQSPTLVARLAAAAVRDQGGAWLGRPPHRIKSIGTPGEVAMMTSPGAYELVLQMAGAKREELLAENDVAARIAIRVPFYSPGRRAAKITAPTLVQLATKDDVTPYVKAQRIVARIPRGEVRSYDCTHFEPYLDPYFDAIVSDQVDFLDRHVGCTPMTTLPTSVQTLIVGAGFAGLAAAAAVLRDDPDADVLIIEQADEVGGTWRDNTYPGCACDVPTSLYSFSFTPSAKWSHTFARQPEIYRYLKSVADDTGLRQHLITGCALLDATWDAGQQTWRVRTSAGDLTARILVAATGALSTPKLPDVDGLDTFTGNIFHSASWDHGHDLTGERVAVVGTGASAVQFVPEIADRTAHLTVFQRTPAWVMPRLDRTLSVFEKALYRRIPLAQRAVRATVYGYREIYLALLAHLTWLLPVVQLIAKAQLRRQVRDRALRQALTPNFTIGCKRILLTNDWLPTLARNDVTVITNALAEVTRTGVRDASGTHHDVDTIIFATGFTPTEPPVARLLTGSHDTTLAEHWSGSPAAHLGTTVAGFPNLFLMYGPNTNLGHSSIVYMLESQAAYLAAALRVMRTEGLVAVDVQPHAQHTYNTWVDDALTDTVWNSGGCSSWYLDANGRNSVMWPTFTFRFRNKTAAFDVHNYSTVPTVRSVS